MTEFEKCKAALGSYKVVKKFEEKLLLRNIHLSDYGRLDFRRYKSAHDISFEEISRLPDFLCCVIFSDPNIPPLKCRFKRMLECKKEVLAVSRNIWVLNENCSKIIEIYRGGTITLCEI